MINKYSKIFVAGHSGMLGSNIMLKLQAEGYLNIITRGINQLDLTNQKETDDFFDIEKPQFVILAAGKVGGIGANIKFAAEFIYQNLLIEANIIHAAYMNGVEKLIFLGTSSVYPKGAEQPFAEESLLTGSLEPTNEPYSIAKIAGIKMCEAYYKQYDANFYTIMPANLYGPFDHFEEGSSHVIPALFHKFSDAKINSKESVELWGTGKPLREFLYAPDLANAIVFLLENVDAKDIYQYEISALNVGSSIEISIQELAESIASIVGYKGSIIFNKDMPDGVSRKVLNSKIINKLGWHEITSIKEGLNKTFKWYQKNIK